MRFLSQLIKALTRWEKVTLALSALLIVAGVFGKTLAARASLRAEPDKGGEFTEGIVADTAAAVDREIETLTNAPLVKFDKNGVIAPALAKSWDIKQDGRLYVFHLIDGFKSDQAAQAIKNQKSSLSQVEVATPDDKTLELRLKQPFSPLLADLTRPIFSAGFYKVKKRTSTKIVLESQSSPLGEPYIPLINVEVFTSLKSLGEGLAQQRLTGAVYTNADLQGYNKYSLTLRRRQMLFFNTSRDLFKDKSLRKAIKGASGLDGRVFEITTVSQSPAEQTALKLIDDLTSRGADVKLHGVDQSTLEKEIVPKRDFDALLVTVDFGRDPDPYSFWHSTQIEGGQNISGFANKKADRILEDARLTSDENKRKELYDQLQKILEDESPAVFLDREMVQYFASKRVKGIAIGEGITPADRFDNVNSWYIKTKKVKK